MEKGGARCYATAQALADGVRRFLDDEPIHARPPTLRGRVRSASEQIRDVGPQDAPFFALRLGELGQGVWAAHAVEVRVALRVPHPLTDDRAGLVGVLVQLLSPGVEVSPQPVQRLPAESGALGVG
jgi:hypothetical protein